MEKVWVVASGKGGTGKSTIVANLGVALAAEGRRVLLVDLNVGLRCLDLCLGMDDRVLFDVMDVLEGTCRARTLFCHTPALPRCSCCRRLRIVWRLILTANGCKLCVSGCRKSMI